MAIETTKVTADEPVALSYASTHWIRPQRLPGDHHVVYGIKLVLTGVVLVPVIAGIVAVFLCLVGVLDPTALFGFQHS